MNRDGRVRVLPENVINKIAAGEVVERPASVVKELVENSLDSAATLIEIAVVAGGRKLISVSDNGCGMTRDDSLLAIQRHATSKISDVDDIEHIATLGFRGEALAALASVSRLRLVTCRAGEPAGTELLMMGGVLRDVREIGAPQGTSVEVRDLFFNVPARRKFLRSPQTELAHVRTVFLVHALGHPAVGMSLQVDGNRAQALPPDGTLDERIQVLFGAECLRGLRKVDHHAQGIRVTGYTGVPSLSRADRSEQFVFVNGRPTAAAVLSHAIREAYHTLLPADRHPTLFLFVELDPGDVDVNVHPTKREVRFRHVGAVRDAVLESIRSALARAAPGTAPAAVPVPPAALPEAAPVFRIDNLPAARSFAYPRMALTAAMQPVPPPAGAAAADAGSAAPPASAGTPGSPWSWCRVVGQVGGLYVVLETEDGMVLMDPHAAHERVLFERFTAALRRGDVQSQHLLMPQTVELRPSDAQRVRKNLDAFADMGFGICEFGADAFVVDAVPAPFAGADCAALLLEIAQHLETAGARGGRERWREEAIAQAACKAAVKARQSLTLEEIEKLVVDLAETEMPYTCPHGRPTLIMTSLRELHRKFGRE